MPVVKSFTQAQWDAAARRLDGLPEKPAHEHRVNVRDAVKSMRSQITGAQSKGYTLDEIVAQLAQDGVEISASTLRYAMQRAAKEGVANVAGKRIETTLPTPPRAPSPRGRKAGESSRSRMDGATTESSQDGGRAVNKPGAMVIRDAFSFEITPDTDNL